MASQDEPENEGLLSGIAGMFREKKPAAVPSSAPSANSSTSEPLSAESERLLNSVPDSIGGEPGGIDEPGEGGQLSAMIDGLVFKPEHVEVLMRGIFKALGWFFDAEHWELSDSETGWVTEPATQMLNFLWLDNRDDISNRMLTWVMNTPGALGLLIGGGVVLGPRISKQMSLARERRNSKPLVQEPRTPPQPIRPAPAQPKNGIVFDGKDGN